MVFFGSSRFSVPVLEMLKAAGFKPQLIVTAPDKPKGRGLKQAAGAVKLWAQKENVKILQPHKLDAAFAKKIKAVNCKFIVVASYGKIIPKEILGLPEKGALNVHPSLLPRWRGADPIRAAILAGDGQTGVSIMIIDEQIDHGAILRRKIFKLKHKKYDYLALENELAKLGGRLIAKTIPKWLAGKIKPRAQNHSKATYAPKIKKEDGRINWRESAYIIERKIRAFNPWPGAYALWNGKRIKMIDGYVIKLKTEPGSCQRWQEPGSGFVKLAIGAADGSIAVSKLQLEGKNPQNAAEFINGHPDVIGSVLN